MVTIRTCYSLPEAQVIQSHLQGSGIEAFLPDEMTVQNDWLLTNALGGVRVQVWEDDAERAAEVLREASAGNEQETAKICPHCGAELKEYLAQFVGENPELLPARLGGGSGAGTGQRSSPEGAGVDLARIKPGMNAEEMDRARQEIARVAAQTLRGL